MSSLAYETLSFAMRYWFLALVIAILIALIYVSYKQYTERKLVKTTLDRFSGYLEIIRGPEEFLGDKFGIRGDADNLIGSAEDADIMLPDESVAPEHAYLYQGPDSLVLSPTRQGSTKINGRRTTRDHQLRTGDIISIGDIDFALRLKRKRITDDN